MINYGYIKNILFQKLFGNYSNSFLIIAIFFGILMLIIVPPMQIPDEQNHFFKVYSLAESTLNPILQDNQLGDYLPYDIIHFVYTISATNKISIATNYDVKFDPLIYKEFLSQQINKQNTQFIGFTNTASKTLIVYLPAVLAVFIGNLFNLAPLFLFELARICLFMFFVTIGYLIIKKSVKSFQPIAFVTFLMPMTLFLSIGITADTLTILASTAFVAYVLKLRDAGNPIRYHQIFIILSFAILLGLIKSTYATLALLIYLVPPFYMKSNLKDFILKSCIILIPAFIVLYGIVFGAKVSVPLRLDVVIAPAEQLQFLINHPLKFFDLIVIDFINNAKTYYIGLIGVLGWLDTNLPSFTYVLATLAILVATLNGNTKKFTLTEQVIILFIIVFSYMFTMFFLYLLWTPVGTNAILGYQGRYLLPFLPLVLVLLQSTIRIYKIKFNQYFILIFLIILIQLLAVKSLIYRYYLIS